MKLRLIFFAAAAGLVLGCGGDDPAGPGGGGSNLPAALTATYGTYALTYTTSTVLADGTTRVVAADKDGANLVIGPSRPGVMGVDPGTTVPGVDPADVIYGAAYVQNPAYVFLGTDTADRDGDFGLWSSVVIGVPTDPVNLQYDGCEGEGGPFACSPRFFESTTIGDAVNLIYFATSVTRYANGDIDFSGTLVDDHRSEAAAANGFSLQADHDILGPGVYPYLYDEGATFDFRVRDGAVTGTITGTGRALIGAEPGVVQFTVTFGGGKRY